jgi:hypothetical protein
VAISKLSVKMIVTVLIIKIDLVEGVAIIAFMKYEKTVTHGRENTVIYGRAQS